MQAREGLATKNGCHLPINDDGTIEIQVPKFHSFAKPWQDVCNVVLELSSHTLPGHENHYL
jgi:hypothetical protein